MKFLKRLLIVLLVLVVLVVVAGFFLPSKYKVERSALINSEPSKVYGMVASLQKWPQWDPFSASDTAAKYTYTGQDMQEGSAQSWDSEKLGNGKMTLTKLVPNKRVEMKLDFEGEESGAGYIDIEDIDGKSKVTWEMHGDLGNNPIQRYMGLFMDGMLGNMFDDGLEKLEKVTTSNP